MVGLSKIFVDWFKGKSSPETMGFPKKVPLDFSRQLQRFNQKPVVSDFYGISPATNGD